jgi:hypothetical protein
MERAKEIIGKIIEPTIKKFKETGAVIKGKSVRIDPELRKKTETGKMRDFTHGDLTYSHGGRTQAARERLPDYIYGIGHEKNPQLRGMANYVKRIIDINFGEINKEDAAHLLELGLLNDEGLATRKHRRDLKSSSFTEEGEKVLREVIDELLAY